MSERPPSLELIKVHDTEWGFGDSMTFMLGLVALQWVSFAVDDLVGATLLSAMYLVTLALLFEHGSRHDYHAWQRHQEWSR
ncbi:hypothetical protein ACFQJC_05115 [Haloferax namakaokahaiae]|uniref:Uncharacterized protein n=1 Tax=Haloferax namakaokahaiae TaxID=1748331 RepID=A0ABD5ZCK0_9EURY